MRETKITNRYKYKTNLSVYHTFIRDKCIIDNIFKHIFFDDIKYVAIMLDKHFINALFILILYRAAKP